MNDGIQAVNLIVRNSALGRVLPVGEKSSTTAISLKLPHDMQNLLLGLSSRKLGFVSWLEC
jgi:hypothetical protein